MALQKILLLAVLLITPPQKLQKDIKQKVNEIKLVAYSSKDPKKVVEEIQTLIIQLSIEVEKLDGK